MIEDLLQNGKLAKMQQNSANYLTEFANAIKIAEYAHAREYLLIR